MKQKLEDLVLFCLRHKDFSNVGVFKAKTEYTQYYYSFNCFYKGTLFTFSLTKNRNKNEILETYQDNEVKKIVEEFLKTEITLIK